MPSVWLASKCSLIRHVFGFFELSCYLMVHCHGKSFFGWTSFTNWLGSCHSWLIPQAVTAWRFRPDKQPPWVSYPVTTVKEIHTANHGEKMEISHSSLHPTISFQFSSRLREWMLFKVKFPAEEINKSWKSIHSIVIIVNNK